MSSFLYLIPQPIRGIGRGTDVGLRGNDRDRRRTTACTLRLGWTTIGRGVSHPRRMPLSA